MQTFPSRGCSRRSQGWMFQISVLPLYNSFHEIGMWSCPTQTQPFLFVYSSRCPVSHWSHRSQPGVVLTFGQGDVGQLGLGEEIMERKKPAAVSIPDAARIIDVIAGGMHTVCVSEKGEVRLQTIFFYLLLYKSSFFLILVNLLILFVYLFIVFLWSGTYQNVPKGVLRR